MQPLVERKFVMKETWELEKIEHKSVKLPYVLLENKSIVINKSFLPIRLVKIRLQIYNKEIQVGRILYDGPLRLPSQSRQPVVMEVRLSHITAFFNMLRFLLIDTIRMDIRGEIQLRILGIDFFVPVKDHIEMPKSKFKMIIKTIQNDKSSVTSIPFEEMPIIDDDSKEQMQSTSVVSPGHNP